MKLLALVHISSRYHVGEVLEEASEVYEPVVGPPRFRPRRDPFPRARRALQLVSKTLASAGSPASLGHRPLTRSREARKERRVSEKVVLAHDDLRRTLRRIAHEIAEKNPESSGLGDRRDSHPRRRARPPPAHPARRADRRRAADRRHRHLLLPRRRRRQGARRAAGRPRLPHRLRPRRPHRRPRRRRALHRAHRTGGDRCPLRLRPPRAGAARRALRPRPPRAADPTRLRRQEPADGAPGAGQRPPRGERRGRRGDDLRAAGGGGCPHEAPAGDRAALAGGDRGDPRPSRELRRGRPARHQEGADPARAHRRQPLL